MDGENDRASRPFAQPGLQIHYIDWLAFDSIANWDFVASYVPSVVKLKEIQLHWLCWHPTKFAGLLILAV